MQEIISDAWLLPLGQANAVLLRDRGELTLVDTGFPDKEQIVFEAIRSIGHKESDLKHIILTHAHPDHIGSAAAILKHVEAETWIHEIDADIAEGGGPFRPMAPAKGLLQQLLYKLIWHPGKVVGPVAINQRVREGDVLPVAGGLQVVHTPGHCAGQMSLLWQGSRLLVAADVGTNMLGLGDPLGFEDEAEGHRSQAIIAQLNFEAAAFGHGSCIKTEASKRVRNKWSQAAS